MQEKKTSRRCIPAHEAEKSVFATNLRECMERKGVTQTALANMIGMQRQTISLYMNGQSSPNAEILTDIDNALGVSADYLLGLSVVPIVNEDLAAAHEYTGLTPAALQSICSWSSSYQQIGHAVYTPINMLSQLCENDKFRLFLFELIAAIHYKNPPEFSYGSFLSELNLRLGEDKRSLFEDMSINDLINLVYPLNEWFGTVALDSDHAAEFHLSCACDRIKDIFSELTQKKSAENGE